MNDSSLYSTDTLCSLTKLEVDGPKFVFSSSTALLRYQVFFNPASRANASCWLFPSGMFPQGHKCLNEEEREEFSFLPFVDLYQEEKYFPRVISQMFAFHWSKQ